MIERKKENPLKQYFKEKGQESTLITDFLCATFRTFKSFTFLLHLVEGHQCLPN